MDLCSEKIFFPDKPVNDVAYRMTKVRFCHEILKSL